MLVRVRLCCGTSATFSVRWSLAQDAREPLEPCEDTLCGRSHFLAAGGQYSVITHSYDVTFVHVGFQSRAAGETIPAILPHRLYHGASASRATA